jgi:hypothetical protein
MMASLVLVMLKCVQVREGIPSFKSKGGTVSLIDQNAGMIGEFIGK